MKTTNRLSLLVVALAGVLTLPPPAGAVSYFPMSDVDLARLSQVIVVAEVVDQEAALAGVGNPVTHTSFKVLEVLKGSLPEETFTVPLPGGRSGKMIWSAPGTPSFLPGQEVLLFLHPRGSGEYGLSEFALSKFDVVEDGKGNRFAFRPTFAEREERQLSRLDSSAYPAGAARQLQPFLEGLRKVGRGGVLPEPLYAVPAGRLQVPRRAMAPLWVNIGGREPGNCGGQECLFRWFWDTGDSPNAVVRITGAQTNLSDGSNGHAAIGSAITSWTAVANTDIRYSGPSPTGNVEVQLDLDSHPSGTWTAPIDCSGGVAGTGGPMAQGPPLTFKGDSYFVSNAGVVRMRKNICTTGYPLNRFTIVALHEIGHSMGLGHPDQAQSVHSTTSAVDWNVAVMRSSLQNPVPSGPQTDDIQAMQYYYGTGALGNCIPNLTTLCLAGGRFQVRADWTTPAGQNGAGIAIPETSDTGMFWFFTSNNIEMIIKVLNACPLNNNFWVFMGGLTNVNTVVTVTDTLNGRVKTYVNPQNTAFQPTQDTNAFTCP